MTTSNHTSPALSPGPRMGILENILAVATPGTPAARAILRLTGKTLFDDLASVGLKIDRSQPRRSIRRLFVPSLAAILEIELLLWFGPHSYTAQDLAEIHMLGSPPLVQAVVERLLANGVRLAEPGEFTLRAFLAGKLDFTQVDAIPELIGATDRETLRNAFQQYAGNISKPLHRVRDLLIGMLAEIEAALDFSEEDIAFIEQEEAIKQLRECSNLVQTLLTELERCRTTEDPFRVVFIGPANAGKSSLVNALLGRPMSLVSSQAGTTRDFVTGTLQCQDIAIQLVDTAGMEGPHPSATATSFDALSTKQRERQIAQAALIVHCADCNASISALAVELETDAPHAQQLYVRTKSDLDSTPSESSPSVWHRTSSATGEGIQELREIIAHFARGASRNRTGCNQHPRIRSHLHQCFEHVQLALGMAANQLPPEMLAAEIRMALDELGALIGTLHTEDLLDLIFSRFCIGK